MDGGLSSTLLTRIPVTSCSSLGFRVSGLGAIRVDVQSKRMLSTVP